MPSGKKDPYQAEGLDYGASVAGENVDFAKESHVGSPGSHDRALIDKLKDALKPGDAKRPTGDTAHDRRHSSIDEGVKPSHRDYDEQEENMSRGGLLDALGDTTHEGSGGRRGSILDKIHFGHEQEKRSKQNQNQHPEGGFMHVLKEKMDASRTRRASRAGKIESYKDSTDSTSADPGRLPGNLYSSIRDDAFK
ncbi:hypothetical protein HD806DRAFT_495992 [Xylariaceae sp. AK1471]|nr:hypothetical protein HD806DRAFT_495992 [Xylariaceae sp. AK1471]